jgi:hypothetical protein
MTEQWISGCMVQRISFHDGVVVNFDDHSELVIFAPMRLTLPSIGTHPVEVVEIDPMAVPDSQRPLLDVAGATCTQAACDEHGNLHLEFSTGHQIDVPPSDDTTAWELYGKYHGYMACLPNGEVHVVRHDLPQDVPSG